MNTVVLILFIVIIIILVYYLIKSLRKKEVLSGLRAGNSELIIQPDELKQSDDGYTSVATYSIWVYVNDWNDNYGEQKVIFQRGSIGIAQPGIVVSLGRYDNNLIVESTYVKVNTQYKSYEKDYITPIGNLWTGYSGETSDSANTARCQTGCTEHPECTGYTYYPANTYNNFVEHTAKVPENTPVCDWYSTDVSLSDIAPVSTGDKGVSTGIKIPVNTHACVVPNLELQKWVSVVITIASNSMDIYINGKIVKSCIVAGELANIEKYPVYISPGGLGFNGWTSKFQYWPSYFSPSQVQKIYKNGYSSSKSPLDYEFTISVLKGGETQKSIKF